MTSGPGSSASGREDLMGGTPVSACERGGSGYPFGFSLAGPRAESRLRPNRFP
jgi:hypothetical protein